RPSWRTASASGSRRRSRRTIWFRSTRWRTLPDAAGHPYAVPRWRRVVATMSRRYFEEEMRYLHEAGKAFAQAYPEQARYLNVDSVTDRDPYVERLFEGFAFLTGRIRER